MYMYCTTSSSILSFNISHNTAGPLCDIKYTNVKAYFAIPKVIELGFASCNNSNKHPQLCLKQLFQLCTQLHLIEPHFLLKLN